MIKNELTSDMENAEFKVKRKYFKLEDFKRFYITQRKFENQYSNIYNCRLNALKETLKNRAIENWGRHGIFQISNLSELDNSREQIIIIGTIYKHQELKPSILKELSNELQLIPQPTRSNFYSDKDQLFLEDEMLRVKLSGCHMDPKTMLTGCVCAVIGFLQSDGTFWVEDYCMPGMIVKPSVSFSSKMEGKILFLSGLNLASNPNSMHYELLIEWITGMAGNSETQQDVASIALVIIAGNSVRGSMEIFNYKGYSEAKSKREESILETILATNKFDDLLSEIVKTCCVLVMPGEFDPSGHSLPQQPFHGCTLPKSSRYQCFHSITNPWIGKIGTCVVAGSSGQPINDIIKVTGLVDCSPIDWLEKTLNWRHFAPTAPDTLAAYPYFDSDPFIMQECPDVYFVGNMKDYSTKLSIGQEGQQVRLIGIPEFSKTHTAVLVDLDSLDAQPISFGTN
ncbi:DNA polymerase delta subunit 2-like [Chelonus insularis]|uniref:DNA polymerase delta subunit 2-like n=1 Tax=Chelonus insularis TaxID=460826 RepID=UPI00158BF10D|nr:DNA polymerase delta subunit 2-like [Chelonus insularis]XP_034937453.1 DNA polymerase delta subunit 2-like [Chelonus insularis]XP_034937454.1 DNA polymerase delta subunit 2-like [Chelonus insularis]